LTFPRAAGVVKPRQLLCGFDLSDTIFRIFESTRLVEFSRQLSQFRIR
jgi:hypothetical protein